VEVKRETLLAGMQQLVQKYRKPGIVDKVTVQMVAGNPVYVLHGPTKNPPDGLPGRMKLPDVRGRVVVVPVMWATASAPAVPLIVPSDRPVPTAQSPEWLGTPDFPVRKSPTADERDLDVSMWRGFTPIDRRDVATQYFPAPAEPVVTAGEIPKADVSELQVSVDTTGEWGWWTKPFDAQGCLCCTFYQTSVTVFSYVVPQDYCLYIDAWAFFVSGVLPVGETFNVRFLRDGETLLEYDEVIVSPTNPDPAKRCLFSGSTEQVQHSYLRIDRNQTFSVVITTKGLAPFLKTNQDTFCATICVLLHGHLLALLDNRDGGPRPRDVGALRDDLWGTGMLDEVTAGDVQQLLAWMDGASANASPEDVTPAGSNAGTADVAAPRMVEQPVAQKIVEPPKADDGSINKIVGGGILAAVVAAAALGENDGSSVSPSPLS